MSTVGKKTSSHISISLNELVLQNDANTRTNSIYLARIVYYICAHRISAKILDGPCLEMHVP